METKISLPPVNRVNIRARTRHKNPKPSSHIKSAWVATALLTAESVYHAVTAPAWKSNVIREEPEINKLHINTSGACVVMRMQMCFKLLMFAPAIHAYDRV